MRLVGADLVGDNSDLVDELLERSSSRLDAFVDTFGSDDPKTVALMNTYREILAGNDTLSFVLCDMYLNWAIQNPGHVRGRDDTTEKCDCVSGWLYDSGDFNSRDDTYRPCHRCLPGTHDKWQAETGYLHGG